MRYTNKAYIPTECDSIEDFDCKTKEDETVNFNRIVNFLNYCTQPFNAPWISTELASHCSSVRLFL